MTQRNVPLTPQQVVQASYLYQIVEVFFISTAFNGGQVFSAGQDQQFGPDTFDVCFHSSLFMPGIGDDRAGLVCLCAYLGSRLM